jgi:hypothetical protein
VSEAARYAKFIETLRSAQRELYASASEEARERYRTCECGFCSWIRSIDEMIAAYDEGKR